MYESMQLGEINHKLSSEGNFWELVLSLNCVGPGKPLVLTRSILVWLCVIPQTQDTEAIPLLINLYKIPKIFQDPIIS